MFCGRILYLLTQKLCRNIPFCFLFVHPLCSLAFTNKLPLCSPPCSPTNSQALTNSQQTLTQHHKFNKVTHNKISHTTTQQLTTIDVPKGLDFFWQRFYLLTAFYRKSLPVLIRVQILVPILSLTKGVHELHADVLEFCVALLQLPPHTSPHKSQGMKKSPLSPHTTKNHLTQQKHTLYTHTLMLLLSNR